jgi:hypothetical protein
VALRQRFGRDLAEYQDPQRHKTDNHRETAVRRHAVGDAGRQRRGEDVDQIVANQNCDQEVLGSGGPAVQTGAGETAAFLTKGFEPGDGQRGQGGFGGRKKAGPEQAEDDHDDLSVHCVCSRVSSLQES